jgi:hypothetical protein
VARRGAGRSSCRKLAAARFSNASTIQPLSPIRRHAIAFQPDARSSVRLCGGRLRLQRGSRARVQAADGSGFGENVVELQRPPAASASAIKTQGGTHVDVDKPDASRTPKGRCRLIRGNIRTGVRPPDWGLSSAFGLAAAPSKHGAAGLSSADET